MYAAACLQQCTWLLKRCIELGQAGFEVTLGRFRPHRQQLLVVAGLNALVVALRNVAQLALIFVMIQRDDLQYSVAANDSTCFAVSQTNAELSCSQAKMQS